MSVIITDKGAYSEVLFSGTQKADNPAAEKAEATDTEEKSRKRKKTE